MNKGAFYNQNPRTQVKGIIKSLCENNDTRESILNGVIFRRWANKILKNYMLKGYAINQKRLEYLEKTVKLIDIVNRIDERLQCLIYNFKNRTFVN